MRFMLLGLLVALVVFAVSGGKVLGATAAGAAPAPAAAELHLPSVPARIGFGSRGFGTRRTSRPGSRYGPYRPRRRHGFARGVFHGLFWGWLLGHVFGGGFPLVLPLLLLVVVLLAARRRRPRAGFRW